LPLFFFFVQQTTTTTTATPPSLLFCNNKNSLKVSAHIGPDSGIVKETLNAANSADGNILIPDFLVGELHDILLGDVVDEALNLAGAHATAGGNDLSADILSDGGGAVKGKENRGLELSLGALNFGLGDVAGKARPLTKREVNKVIDLGELVGHQVDTPETRVKKKRKTKRQQKS